VLRSFKLVLEGLHQGIGLEQLLFEVVLEEGDVLNLLLLLLRLLDDVFAQLRDAGEHRRNVIVVWDSRLDFDVVLLESLQEVSLVIAYLFSDVREVEVVD